MRICDLIKNQQTYPVELGDTVLATVRAMVERNIGAVPVQHNGKPVEIFSDRGLMKRVVAKGRDPAGTCMAEVMTDDPLTINRNEELENMISLRDIVFCDWNEKDYEMRHMRAYIHAIADA